MKSSHKLTRVRVIAAIFFTLALVLSGLLPFSASDVAASPGFGFLSGSVFKQDGTTAISGATVTAEDYSTGTFASTATTGADGKYLMLLDDTKTYRLKATATGFAAEWHDNTYDKTGAAQVSVAGTSFDDPLVIDFSLSPAGKLSGEVKDPWGGYRSDIPVAAVPADGSPGKFSATTGTDGKYTISDIPQGKYKVAATPSGSTNEDNRRFMEQWYNNKDSFETATEVTVGATAVTGIHFNLKEGGGINGSVRDQNGWAFGVATVYVEDWTSGKLIAQGNTNSSGDFSIRGLATGDYLVYATATGRELDYFEHATSREEARMVHLDAPNWTNVWFNLGPGGSFSGTVRNADGSATVADALVVAQDSTTGKTIRGVKTAANGSYTFPGLAQGFYKVWAAAPGFVREYYDGANGVAEFTDGLVVAVVAGQNQPNINFKLDAGGTISGKVTDAVTGLAVANIAVGVAATTEADGDVPYLPFIAKTDKGGLYTVTGLPFGSYKVSAGGESWDGANPRYLKKWYNGKATWEGADPITVDVSQPTATADFSLQKGGAIKGVLLKAEDGQPVDQWSSPWVSVYVFATEGPLQLVMKGQVRSDGSYIAEGLASGSYLVMAGAYNRARTIYKGVYDLAQATAVQVTAPSDKTSVNFNLEEGRSIEGDVWGNAGGQWERLVDFPVLIKRLDDGAKFSTRTDSNGHYRVDVPFGDYKVLAQGGDNYPEDPWYVSLWYDWKRTEQDAQIIKISEDTGGWWAGFNLPRGGAVSGKVTEADGVTPIAGAWVKAADYGNWEPLGATNTDADGNYRLAIEKRGVRIIAGADGYVPEYYKETADPNQAGRIDVVEGEETFDINFTLTPGGSISGIVYKADGTTPLPEADVIAVSASDPMVKFGTRSDKKDGKYKINVPFDDYKVMARGSKDPSSDPKFAAQWYNEVASWEQATILTISSTVLSKTGINFSLELGGSIMGTVTDEWGNTVWDARIIVRDAATGMLVGSAKMEWLEGDEGWKPAYAVYGLASGQYEVTAWAPNRSRVFFDEKDDWETADKVTVNAPDTKKDINFKLIWADGRISGDVSYSGQVADPENHDVIVIAGDNRMMDYETEEGPGYVLSIAGPGYYTINNVGEGPYMVIAFLDVDDNGLVGPPDPDDPYGFYGEPTPVVITRDEQGNWSRKVGIDIEITDTPKGIVAGKVEMELRDTYEGATVTVGTQTTTSNADGSYFMLIAPGTYDVKISMPGYVPAEMSGVEVGELISGDGPTQLPPVTLVVGDANGDEAINSGDLLLVAGAFGSSPPSNANADVNGDNAVNLYDLAWIAKNFGLN